MRRRHSSDGGSGGGSGGDKAPPPQAPPPHDEQPHSQEQLQEQPQNHHQQQKHQQQQQHHVIVDTRAGGGGDCDTGPSDGDEGSTAAARRSSIYDCWSDRRRWGILLAAAFASMLVPLADVIVLPALPVIAADFSTSYKNASLVISLYVLASGVGALLWGPAADAPRVGRRYTGVAAGALFLAASLGCMFAPTRVAGGAGGGIAVLIALRALQGFAVSAYLTLANAVVADVFPPARRGFASGVLMLPLLLGPLLGPLIGGYVADAFGWRACFAALAAAGALAAGLLLLNGETLHLRVLRRLQRRDPAAAARVKERDEIEAAAAAALAAPSPLRAALATPLRCLVAPAVAPTSLCVLLAFGANFASLAAVPEVLAQPPYALSASLVGVFFLSDGGSGVPGSLLGGWISDRASARAGGAPHARVKVCSHGALLLAAGLVLFAWALHVRLHLAVVVAAQALQGFGCAVWLPGAFSFVTTHQPAAEAASCAAALQACMFLSAGVVILATGAAVQACGFGVWFTVLGVLTAGSAVLAHVTAAQAVARHLRDERQVQQAAAGGGGGSGGLDVS